MKSKRQAVGDDREDVKTNWITERTWNELARPPEDESKVQCGGEDGGVPIPPKHARTLTL